MRIKKVFTILLILCCLGVSGGYVAYHGYKSARQIRLVKQARFYLARSNERKALLCLQRALRYNPKDIQACRLMAELTERLHSPGALIWRSRVLELNPRSAEDRLALAKTALVFRDYAASTNALEGIDAAARRTAAYHNVAGAVATALNHLEAAEVHFVQASQLESGNLAPQLNLAIIRLHGTNAARVGEARSTLRAFSKSPTNAVFRYEALRELLGDAIASRQTNAALALSKNLIRETNSTFSDRLLRLDLLKQSQDVEFKRELGLIQREAGTNMAWIRELGTWQMSAIGPAETLAWLEALPLEVQTNQLGAMLGAECRTMVGDWKGLRAFLQPQDWVELDFARLAFLSRALREQDLAGGAKAEWELALKAANSQKASLLMLQRLAAQWNWQSEAEDLLWTIVNRYPEEKWASQSLTRVLYTGGRTRPLMMLFSQEVKRTPSDLSARNNLAITALLLDAKEMKPHELAREVYQQAPTNASFASTYAFSLYVQEKNAEALKVMQQLKPQDLGGPSVAGYYGLILKASGDLERAKSYLETAAKAQLLPEERKLFEQAKAGS
jgi:hypothetical protein